MTPVVLHETPAMTVGAVGPFCLGRWRAVPDVEGFRAMQAAIATWAAPGHPFVAINVVDVRSLTHIPDDVRKEIARVQESFAESQLGLATVIPERGFYAAAVRGVASAVQMLSKARFPQRVFGDTADAAVWGVGLLAPHASSFGAGGAGVVSAVGVVAALDALGKPP